MKKKHTPYSYCIFYIEKDYYKKLNQELKAKGYDNVKAIVPTVNILRKSRKGKMVFEEVPILFNFGFMRIPTELSYSRPFLNKLRRDISGIRTFLKATHTMHPSKKRRRIDNSDDFDDYSLVATCSRKEVRRFKRISRDNKRFSVDDLMNVKIGDYIVLKGYPYEGIDASILEIDHLCKRVKVLIFPEMGRMEVWLTFDHVIYSVYQNHDPDKLYANSSDFNPENITKESIDNIMKYKK